MKDHLSRKTINNEMLRSDMGVKALRVYFKGQCVDLVV